ncbi:MAG: mycofactocin biosynthesis chaperone MftB [Acidimicrobiales bacterium]
MRGLLSARPEFDAAAAWELDPRVAIRPEPFGALAYHYGNRRLTFLRAPELVTLVKDLGRHESVDAALESSTISTSRWPAFRDALANLAGSEVIRAR